MPVWDRHLRQSKRDERQQAVRALRAAASTTSAAYAVAFGPKRFKWGGGEA